MILTVRVPTWELEEVGRVLRVGDVVSTWLTFREADAIPPLAEGVQVLEGAARSLPSWPGGTMHGNPVQIDFAGGALYWDAPESIEGAVEVAGTVCTNNVDAPDGFPETTGVLRRIQMEWDDFVMGSDGAWRSTGDGRRYEEVPATYFPPVEAETLDPEVEADLKRLARQAYDREVSLGRLNPGDTFTVTLGVHRTAPEVSPGSTKTRWTGVLLDLEIADVENPAAGRGHDCPAPSLA